MKGPIATASALLDAFDLQLTCVDIGAAGGLHKRVEGVSRRATIVAFDADEDEVKRLNAAATTGRRFIHAAVGAEGQKVTVHLNRNRQSSSVYPWDRARTAFFTKLEDNAARLMVERTVELSTRGLRVLCREHGLGDLDLLKVDTEGYEFPILNEAPEDILAVEVEVNFFPLRVGASQFDQVAALMRRRRYLLFDLRRYFWNADPAAGLGSYGSKGLLILGDALYLLDPFLAENHERLRRPGAALRLAALMCLYGYGAESIMSLRHLASVGVLDPAAASRAEALVADGFRGGRKLPRFIGRVLRKFLTIVEDRVELPFAVREGVGRHPLYQGDELLGTGLR